MAGGGIGIPTSGAGNTGGSVKGGGNGGGGKAAKNSNVKIPKPTGQPKATQAKPPPAPKPPKAAPANWLAPLSQQQITNRATNEVSKAYAPAFAETAAETATANGLADKRASDNQYYQTWLDTQGAALQAQATQANAALAGQEQSLTSQQASLYGGQSAGLINAANATTGNVSNEANNSAYTTDLQQNQANNEGSLINAETAANARGVNQVNQITGTALNDNAVLQAGREKQLSDLQTTLTNIATANSKTSLTEGAAIQKEIVRLQGVEISKANANRNFAATEQKIGVTAADNAANNATSQANNERTTSTSLANNENTENTSAANNERTTSTSAANNQRSTSTSAANNAANNAVKVAISQATLAAKAGQPATPAQIRTIATQVDKISGLADRLVSQNKLTPQQAYHIMQNGGYVQTPAGASGKPGKEYIAPVGNTQLLNAAYNLRSGGSGLTPGDVSALKAMGIYYPTQQGWKTAPTPNLGPPKPTNPLLPAPTSGIGANPLGP